MTVILDSNVLLVAIGKSSRFRPIWNSFIQGKFQIGLTQDIFSEYEEVLQEHGAPGAFELVANIFAESPDVIFKHIYYRWNAITADADDNKFFDAAVACNADYLVTNDIHFNVIKNLNFPKKKAFKASSGVMTYDYDVDYTLSFLFKDGKIRVNSPKFDPSMQNYNGTWSRLNVSHTYFKKNGDVKSEKHFNEVNKFFNGLIDNILDKSRQIDNW